MYEQMHANGCQPDVVTYTALISAYERGGQWLLALEAFEEMVARGCWPDAIVYNAIIDALWQTGVVWAQVRPAGKDSSACAAWGCSAAAHAVISAFWAATAERALVATHTSLLLCTPASAVEQQPTDAAAACYQSCWASVCNLADVLVCRVACVVLLVAGKGPGAV